MQLIILIYIKNICSFVSDPRLNDLQKVCYETPFFTPKWLRIPIAICTINSAAIVFYQQLLNFSHTHKFHYELKGIESSTIIFDRRSSSYQPYHIQSREWRPSIIYCRSEVRLSQDSNVWVSPLDINVWLAFGITCVLMVLCYLVKTKVVDDGVVKEIIFVLGSILRQMHYPMRLLHLPFVITCIILVTSYESLFTGRIIAPTEPSRYENIGQFVNDSNKVLCIDTVRCNYLINETMDISATFAKNGILQKMDKFFEVLTSKYGIGPWLIHQERILKLMADSVVNNLALYGVLVDVDTVKQRLELHIFTLQMDFRLKQLRQRLEVGKCYALDAGSVSYFYNVYRVPFLKSLTKLDMASKEFGFLNVWERNYFSRVRHRLFNTITRIKKLYAQVTFEESYVGLKHMQSFLFLWLLLLGITAFVFCLEIVRNVKTYLSKYKKVRKARKIVVMTRKENNNVVKLE